MASKWTVRQVGEWLDVIGMGHLKRSFADNGVDGLTLLDLSSDDLRYELNITNLQQRKMIQASIMELGGRNPQRRTPDEGGHAAGSPLAHLRNVYGKPPSPLFDSVSSLSPHRNPQWGQGSLFDPIAGSALPPIRSPTARELGALGSGGASPLLVDTVAGVRRATEDSARELLEQERAKLRELLLEDVGPSASTEHSHGGSNAESPLYSSPRQFPHQHGSPVFGSASSILMTRGSPTGSGNGGTANGSRPASALGSPTLALRGREAVGFGLYPPGRASPAGSITPAGTRPPSPTSAGGGTLLRGVEDSPLLSRSRQPDQSQLYSLTRSASMKKFAVPSKNSAVGAGAAVVQGGASPELARVHAQFDERLKSFNQIDFRALLEEQRKELEDNPNTRDAYKISEETTLIRRASLSPTAPTLQSALRPDR